MKKLWIFSALAILFCFTIATTYAQQYGVCVWEKKDDKLVYISFVFKYKEDAQTGYSTNNTALICSAENSLKIEVGSKYKNYTTTFYLRKDRNLFYPYTEDEAIKLRTKLISEFRGKDYTVHSLDVAYDRDACKH